jgi:phosphate transport system protein
MVPPRKSMFRTSVDALIRQDHGLAESVVAQKEEIHAPDVRIEEHCNQLIAPSQPMAKDMRVIACPLKAITAPMRIGRYGRSSGTSTGRFPHRSTVPSGSGRHSSGCISRPVPGFR